MHLHSWHDCGSIPDVRLFFTLSAAYSLHKCALQGIHISCGNMHCTAALATPWFFLPSRSRREWSERKRMCCFPPLTSWLFLKIWPIWGTGLQIAAYLFSLQLALHLLVNMGSEIKHATHSSAIKLLLFLSAQGLASLLWLPAATFFLFSWTWSVSLLLHQIS